MWFQKWRQTRAENARKETLYRQLMRVIAYELLVNTPESLLVPEVRDYTDTEGKTRTVLQIKALKVLRFQDGSKPYGVYFTAQAHLLCWSATTEEGRQIIEWLNPHRLSEQSLREAIQAVRDRVAYIKAIQEAALLALKYGTPSHNYNKRGHNQDYNRLVNTYGHK